ncbi:MAG TPA: TetR/AcrR family transcriptional regulator [Pseudonocardia sp.]
MSAPKRIDEPAPAQPVPAARRSGRVRREEIVAAAARIFARQGYAAVGMRDIAEAVGIRGASLYHHFRAKEEILYAVCLTVTRELNEQNLPFLDAPGTPAQRLAAFVRAHLEFLHPRRVEHTVGLHELAALTPPHRAEIDEYRRYYQRRVRDVIAAGMRSGEFTAIDARLAAFATFGVLNGISTWFHDDGELGLEEVVRGYVVLIVGRMLGAREYADDQAGAVPHIRQT